MTVGALIWGYDKDACMMQSLQGTATKSEIDYDASDIS